MNSIQSFVIIVLVGFLISLNYQNLGQGAYSYTEIDIPLYQMVEFIEEGYVHITMQVTADTVFETGFERTGLNVGAMDIYRPDLKDLKNDVLYNIEKDGIRETNTTNITGFKRKFSEYFITTKMTHMLHMTYTHRMN